MTKRERWGFAWFVVACCMLTGAINWALAQPQVSVQPQQRLTLRGKYDLIELESGSQWYLQQGSINAIWGVPRDQQEKLGFATKIYGVGYECTFPFEITEILTKIYAGDKAEIDALLRMMENQRNAKSDSK